MSLVVVGLSHRSAPLPVLERASLAGDDLRKALHELVSGEHITEAVVVSTCNRVEVYAETATFHGGVAEIGDMIARSSGMELTELRDALYPLHDARAVQHLFAVACGLDSLLVGEAQIQGQLRSAFRTAEEEGTAGRTLGELFRHAVRVGRRARTETAIDAAGRSLVDISLRQVTSALGTLEGQRVLVVGAGAAGSLAGQRLRAAGVGEIVVANRSADKAERLAGVLTGRAVGLDAVAAELAAADIVVSTTSAVGYVATHAVVAAALPGRDGRPLALVDLALPRDIDPAVRDLPGVTLVDLEGLRTVLEREPAGADVAAVRAIVDEEVEGFAAWRHARRVAPTVTALREKADGVVTDEMQRLIGRLPELDDVARGEVEQTVRRVVDKLLHAPTVRVKELAATDGGDRYAEALRELFDLDPGTLSAVSEPVPPGLEATP